MFVNIILHLAVAAVGWPQRNLASKTINYFRIAVKINLHQAALSEAKRKQIKKLTKHHLFYFWSENPSKISLHKLKLWELLQIFIGFNLFSLRYAVFANFVLTGTPSVLNTRIGTVPVLKFSFRFNRSEISRYTLQYRYFLGAKTASFPRKVCPKVFGFVCTYTTL